MMMPGSTYTVTVANSASGSNIAVKVRNEAKSGFCGVLSGQTEVSASGDYCRYSMSTSGTFSWTAPSQSDVVNMGNGGICYFQAVSTNGHGNPMQATFSVGNMTNSVPTGNPITTSNSFTNSPTEQTSTTADAASSIQVSVASLLLAATITWAGI